VRVNFDQDRYVDILPFEDNLSQKWYDEVCTYANHIHEKDRIYGFADNWDYDRCIQEIQTQAKIINDYKSFIDFDISNLDQQKLNKLHVFFESMIGIDTTNPSGEDLPGEFFFNAPLTIKKAIERFNVMIHRIEGIKPGMKRPDPNDFWSKRIVITFSDRPRYKIPDKEMYRFNFLQEPGDVCFNYCHVGKPLFDVFDNEDDDVTEENVFPQSHWSADFHMIFNRGLSHKSIYNKAVANWWNDNREQLASLGWYEGEPRNAWGLMKVGQVINYNPDFLEGITRVESIEY
jgi:hypothetical protein